MGEVYRAHDTRLRREVAIKVLPSSVAGDEGRLARFEQEALATAALNHPNILVVHDIGRDGGTAYVVAELLEGRTLRTVLDEGLPAVAKAVEYASQIASGLAAAHARGIVHRDLKPENLFVTHDDRVKILDFGLAKAIGQPTAAGGSTVLSPRTEPGTVMGTVGYMAPEQVRGEPADTRADLFSFGAVLYEMLTGRRAFGRETAAETMTAILRDAPPPASSLRTLPPALERLVSRCLEKQPAARFQSASDLAFALQTLGSQTGSDPSIARAMQPAAPRKTRNWFTDVRSLGAMAIAAIAIAVAIVSFTRGRGTEAPDPFPIHIEIGGPPETEIPVGAATLTRDGHSLVYLARAGGPPSFFIRRLDQPGSRAIPGSETAALTSVVLSPDEKWIAYVRNRRQIVKLPLEGGAPVVLADIDDNGGLDWSPGDDVVFGMGADQGLKGLFRMKANNGAVQPLTHIDTTRKELSHQFPRFVDDGKTVLFVILYGSPEQTEIAAVSMDDGKVIPLHVLGRRALGVVDGQLVYVRADGVVMAIPFDVRTLRTTGAATQVVDSIRSAGGQTASLTPAGGLVFARGFAKRRLVWVDRARNVTPAMKEARDFQALRLSPDGRQAALQIGNGSKTDIWILDFAAGTLTPLTSVGTVRNPSWSPDGRRVLFASVQGGPAALWWQPADASGPPVKAADPTHNPWFVDLAPDGRTVIYSAVYDGTFNLATMPLDGSNKTVDFAASPKAVETMGRFSPDGKAVAYASDESGRLEVYVRPFPEGGRVQISADGGQRPVWDSDGKRIYFRDDVGVVMATIDREPTLRVVSRTTLFKGRYGDYFDVTKDGRFLMVEADSSSDSLVVIPNWITELRRLTSSASR